MYDREVYHFLVLHFPIALFITGYYFDVLYSLFNKEEFENFIFWMMGLGIFWSGLSIITGYIAAYEMGYLKSFIDIFDKKHATIMIINTSLFILLFIFRKKNSSKWLFTIHTICVILLLYGAHLGAKWADRI